jgi:NADH-quinone oxidoreductase subunit C
MWDAFKDHPMRRDYVEPDDFEYEPTAHDDVLKRAQAQRSRDQGSATPATEDLSLGARAGNRDQLAKAGQ